MSEQAHATAALLPPYDYRHSYEWNYAHAPRPAEGVVEPRVPGDWTFCGRPVGSPLGVAAGPLLNGAWVLYYAALGFDVLTYKTVRSRARACYPMPNLQPVREREVRGMGDVSAGEGMAGSWAVSFGMPSRPPDVWRRDVEVTRNALPGGKLLSVSVVGSPEPGWTIDQLADDYARCARWAAGGGADCVEANFSCPNVQSCDGQLYQQPEGAGQVAARLREALGPAVPLLVKIGHLTDEESAEALLAALAPHVDALVMVNCVAARVVGADGRAMFAGGRRGIAGDAIRPAAIDQVRLFDRLTRRRGLPVQLVGVGGISTAGHVRQFLDAGSRAVQLATAAIRDPAVGSRIRAGLATTD